MWNLRRGLLALLATGSVDTLFVLHETASYGGGDGKSDHDAWIPVLTNRTNSTVLEGSECPPTPDGIDTSKRLELLHISKTGGTTLEILAAEHNVSWGACHFVKMVDRMPGSLRCPGTRHKADGSIPGVPLWHAPPRYLRKDEMWWLENATLFTVVRDPYERVASAYNYHVRYKGTDERHSATAMNDWVREHISGVYNGRPIVNGTDWRPGYFRKGLLIPQTDYIDEHVRVLRLESLRRDFLCMIREHGLDWEWAKWDEKRRNKSSDPQRPTVANLTDETLHWIEVIYRKDFEDLGYPMMRRRNASKATE